MSKYTTQVRFICETLAGFDDSQDYNKVSEVLEKSWDKVFDFDFPIFDEEYRKALCIKILRHYYTREIGLETIGLWKLKLEAKLNEEMPYFNQLYKSALIEFNPLYDADYTKEHKGKGSGEGVNSSKTVNSDTDVSSGTTWNVFSDTPQGSLVNVENETYLTDARKIIGNNTTNRNGNTNTDGTNSYNNTDEYIEHIVGKFPGRDYSKLIESYRKIMLNIDMDVIDSLGDLFMKIW